MPHSPFWKADSSSASQEISYISENKKVDYHNPKCLPFVTTLNQVNPVHTQAMDFHLILCNINLPPTLRPTKRHLTQVSPPKPCIYLMCGWPYIVIQCG